MMRVECPNLEINLVDCVCTNEECVRRSKCCECVRNHKAHENLPACFRTIASVSSDDIDQRYSLFQQS